MGYKAFASINVAVIGNGKTTSLLAHGLSLAGHEVSIGIKENQSIQLDFPESECESISVTTIEDAATSADVIIMATLPSEVREAAYLLNDVRKKVIIDATYMNYSKEEYYLNTLSAIKSITGSPLVVKCFNAAGFEPLPKVSRRDNAINMFVAGDNKKAKEIAKMMARDLGYSDCHDFGGSDSAPLLDEMAICYYHLSERKEHGEKIAIRITKE